MNVVPSPPTESPSVFSSFLTAATPFVSALGGLGAGAPAPASVSLPPVQTGGLTIVQRERAGDALGYQLLAAAIAAVIGGLALAALTKGK